MSEIKSITINGSMYGLPDPKSVLADTIESPETTWSSQKIDQEVEEAVNPALIVCEALGEVITVSDSATYPLCNLKLFGKTTQVTTTGKNLLDFEECLKAWGSSYTKNGEKYTITSIGTSFTSPSKLFEERTTVSVQAIVKDIYSTNALVEFGYFAEDGTFISIANLNNSANSKGNVAINAIRMNFSVGGTFTVENIQLEKGSTATAYEPYTGGKASPSPEYPQPLESVGADGAICVTVAGKNLFGGIALADKLVEVASSTKDISAGTVTISGANVAHNPMLFDGAFKENTQYTIVLYGRNNVETGDATNLNIFYTDGTNEDIRFPKVSGDRYGVFTTAAGKTVSHIYCRYQSGISILYYDQCGIFEGVLTEADFEPYKGQTLTASTPNGLHGTESVTDEIDFARGVLVQRFKEGVLNGDESWHMSTTDYGDVTYFYASFSDLIKNNGDNMGAIKSDIFIESYGNNTIEHIRVHSMNGRIMLFIKTNRLNDASIAGLSAWLAEHPVNIVYRLATPIETPLTAEELAQYAALHSNKPNTTVFNDATAGMKMDYVADTKTYIDNKLAAISAAVLNA